MKAARPMYLERKVMSIKGSRIFLSPLAYLDEKTRSIKNSHIYVEKMHLEKLSPCLEEEH